MTSGDVEVVVTVAAEGGSLTLYRRTLRSGEIEFFTLLNQAMLTEMIEGLDGPGTGGEPFIESPKASTFKGGLRLMDASPFWPRLYPMKLHPEFSERLYRAAVRRLIRDLKDDHETLDGLRRRWRDAADGA